MRSTTTILSAILICAACSKDDKADDKKTTTTTPDPGATEGTAAAPTPAGKITCDEVVPQAVRDKHFAGQELSEQPAMVASLMQVACSFSKEMDIHTISVTCHPDWPQSTWDTVEAEMKKQVADAKDAAVGKNGWSGTFAGGAHVHTLDDDTACSIDVHGDGDLAAITTDVVASLKPEALAN